MTKPSQSDVYRVERLIASRNRGNKTEYLVKWKNWSDKHNSWEPERNILDQRLIEAFLKSDRHRKRHNDAAGRITLSRSISPRKSYDSSISSAVSSLEPPKIEPDGLFDQLTSAIPSRTTCDLENTPTCLQPPESPTQLALETPLGEIVIPVSTGITGPDSGSSSGGPVASCSIASSPPSTSGGLLGPGNVDSVLGQAPPLPCGPFSLTPETQFESMCPVQAVTTGAPTPTVTQSPPLAVVPALSTPAGVVVSEAQATSASAANTVDSVSPPASTGQSISVASPINADSQPISPTTSEADWIGERRFRKTTMLVAAASASAAHTAAAVASSRQISRSQRPSVSHIYSTQLSATGSKSPTSPRPSTTDILAMPATTGSLSDAATEDRPKLLLTIPRDRLLTTGKAGQISPPTSNTNESSGNTSGLINITTEEDGDATTDRDSSDQPNVSQLVKPESDSKSLIDPRIRARVELPRRSDTDSESFGAVPLTLTLPIGHRPPEISSYDEPPARRNTLSPEGQSMERLKKSVSGGCSPVRPVKSSLLDTAIRLSKRVADDGEDTNSPPEPKSGLAVDFLVDALPPEKRHCRQKRDGSLRSKKKRRRESSGQDSETGSAKLRHSKHRKHHHRHHHHHHHHRDHHPLELAGHVVKEQDRRRQRSGSAVSCLSTASSCLSEADVDRPNFETRLPSISPLPPPPDVPPRLAPLRIHLPRPTLASTGGQARCSVVKRSNSVSSTAAVSTPIAGNGLVMTTGGLVFLPPPNAHRLRLVQDIAVTDVTVNGLTISIKECPGPKDFFGLPTTQLVSPGMNNTMDSQRANRIRDGLRQLNRTPSRPAVDRPRVGSTLKITKNDPRKSEPQKSVVDRPTALTADDPVRAIAEQLDTDTVLRLTTTPTGQSAYADENRAPASATESGSRSVDTGAGASISMSSSISEEKGLSLIVEERSSQLIASSSPPSVSLQAASSPLNNATRGEKRRASQLPQVPLTRTKSEPSPTADQSACPPPPQPQTSTPATPRQSSQLGRLHVKTESLDDLQQSTVRYDSSAARRPNDTLVPSKSSTHSTSANNSELVFKATENALRSTFSSPSSPGLLLSPNRSSTPVEHPPPNMALTSSISASTPVIKVTGSSSITKLAPPVKAKLTPTSQASSKKCADQSVSRPPSSSSVNANRTSTKNSIAPFRFKLASVYAGMGTPISSQVPTTPTGAGVKSKRAAGAQERGETTVIHHVAQPSRPSSFSREANRPGRMSTGVTKRLTAAKSNSTPRIATVPQTALSFGTPAGLAGLSEGVVPMGQDASHSHNNAASVYTFHEESPTRPTVSQSSVTRLKQTYPPAGVQLLLPPLPPPCSLSPSCSSSPSLSSPVSAPLTALSPPPGLGVAVASSMSTAGPLLGSLGLLHPATQPMMSPTLVGRLSLNQMPLLPPPTGPDGLDYLAQLQQPPAGSAQLTGAMDESGQQQQTLECLKQLQMQLLLNLQQQQHQQTQPAGLGQLSSLSVSQPSLPASSVPVCSLYSGQLSDQPAISGIRAWETLLTMTPPPLPSSQQVSISVAGGLPLSYPLPLASMPSSNPVPCLNQSAPPAMFSPGNLMPPPLPPASQTLLTNDQLSTLLAVGANPALLAVQLQQQQQQVGTHSLTCGGGPNLFQTAVQSPNPPPLLSVPATGFHTDLLNAAGLCLVSSQPPPPTEEMPMDLSAKR